MAEILTCAGFFFIYFIEEIVHFFLDSDVHHHHGQTIQAHKTFSIHSQTCDAGLIETQNCTIPNKYRRSVSFPATLTSYKTFDTSDLETNTSNEVLSSYKKSDEISVAQESGCQTDVKQFSKSTLRDFFTVLALSFHAVFEGLAVGLEEEAKDVWLLFAGWFPLDFITKGRLVTKFSK